MLFCLFVYILYAGERGNKLKTFYKLYLYRFVFSVSFLKTICTAAILLLNNFLHILNCIGSKMNL